MRVRAWTDAVLRPNPHPPFGHLLPEGEGRKGADEMRDAAPRAHPGLQKKSAAL